MVNENAKCLEDVMKKEQEKGTLFQNFMFHFLCFPTIPTFAFSFGFSFFPLYIIWIFIFVFLLFFPPIFHFRSHAYLPCYYNFLIQYLFMKKERKGRNYFSKCSSNFVPLLLSLLPHNFRPQFVLVRISFFFFNILFQF